MKQAEDIRILIIYTGGTIGMIENPETGALENFDRNSLLRHIPELKRFQMQIEVETFGHPIDSSDMEPACWERIVRLIADNYDRCDGFVVLHGTDTMAYTASALSFMLENLGKPVVITGSQLPLGKLRTDGKENLLTSIEIAAARDADGLPMVPEVCIFFESRLMRGNRTTKINAEGFNAFRSYNLPSLAHAGIHIRYATHLIRRPTPDAVFKPHFRLDNHVIILTLFPGIRSEFVESVCRIEGLKAVVLKTFGSGNAPQRPWLFDTLRRLSRRGVIVVNVTQCSTGSVEMRRYRTGLGLLKAGVVPGYDATPEAILTKLMMLLGHNCSRDELIRRLGTDMAGEMTVEND